MPSERFTSRKIHVVDLAKLRIRERAYHEDDTATRTNPWQDEECSCCAEARRRSK
jgi:hypothetical protein